MEDIQKVLKEVWMEVVEQYEREEQGEEVEKSYSPSNPWDAPGMSIHDFI